MEWWKILIIIIFSLWAISALEKEIRKVIRRIDDLEDRVGDLEDKIEPKSDIHDWPLM